MKEKEIRVRCWITIGGIKHFGPGPAELMVRIQESGSISKAAEAMGMSYKKAWEMVEHMNKRGSKPYVVTHKGGSKGGGTELTNTGKKVLESYQKLTARIHEVVNQDTHLLKLI
jgi:molybdate transport system regulatory protein